MGIELVGGACGGDVVMNPPEYVVTEVKHLENRGKYFRLELGGRTPVVLNILPGAYRELARRVVMGEPEVDCRVVS
jgi:hypothetical protein